MLLLLLLLPSSPPSGPARRLLVAVLVAAAWLSGAAGQEASEAERLSPFFGTKTRYEAVNRHLLRDPLSLGPPQPGLPLPPAACSPLQLCALLRHGTRFPTRRQILTLGRLHRLLAGPDACPGPARAPLAAWHMWYSPDMDGLLAPRGRHDMSALARRLAARFPRLLRPPGGPRRLRFLSSHKPRCLHSARAFRDALLPAPGASPRE